MQQRSMFLMLVLAGTCGLAAAPIDFTTAIATGARIVIGPDSFKDGLDVTGTIQEYLIANRPFSDAQFVPTGSTQEINESFVQFGTTPPNRSFSSAVSNGAGILEVGVDRNVFSNGHNLAVSRWYTTIKNNTDEDIHFDLSLEFEEGTVEIKGTRFPIERSRARIFAMLDYLLRTPDGGTYVDTTGRLYTYDVLLTNEGRNGTLTTSPFVEALVTNRSTASILSYSVSSAVVDLGATVPTIPGRGELTFYYDMYAYFENRGGENLGSAFIGDPLHLGQTGGISLIQRSGDAVPEPATFVLCGAALIAIPLLHRLGRKKPVLNPDRV